MRKREFTVGVAQMDGAAHINGFVIVEARLRIDKKYCQQAIPDDRTTDHPTPALVRHNATLASVVRDSEKAQLGCVGYFRFILAARRTASAFQLSHPCWRASAPATPAASQTFQRHDGFFKLVTFLA